MSSRNIFFIGSYVGNQLRISHQSKKLDAHADSFFQYLSNNGGLVFDEIFDFCGDSECGESAPLISALKDFFQFGQIPINVHQKFSDGSSAKRKKFSRNF
jgi:hypothetical protein